MGLKFRRGSTAQQSGSLAFGEPYVNTTLGTLVIGGATGDIVLSAGGTGSTGNFGAISGSGLDITGNANIAGNLTLGGAITIGDASSDTVNVVASLSSSLIPQTTNAFDLGSQTKIWKDLYISTGSIKFVDGAGAIATTLSAQGVLNISSSAITFSQMLGAGQFALRQESNNFTGSQSISGNILITGSIIPGQTNAYDLGSETKFWRDLYISTGSIKFVGAGGAIVGTLSNSGNGMSLDGGVITRGDSSFGTSSLAITSVTGSLAVNGRIIATSISGAIAATNGVVSGSSQVIGILDSLNTFSGSQLTQNTALATISGSLISSASANTISVANLNSATASLIIETTNLETFSGSANTRFTEIGVVSGSLITSASAAKTTNDSQGVSITNLNSATASLLIETTNLELFSSSALTRLDNLEGKDFSITLTGDVTGTGTVTNLSNVSFATTVAANSVALGTDTTGNYMSDLTQGTGVTITHTPGEGSNATIAIGQSVATGASPTFAGLTINGAITATGDITAFYTSDKRHKNNIQLIPNALEKVSKLNGVTWEWNDDVHEVTKSTPKTGLIAQEVQEVLPQVVIERQDGFLALDYSKMMGLMVEAIKEQQTQIHSLTIEIEKLKEAKGL